MYKINIRIRISTPRLYLRECTIEDAIFAYQLNLNPEVIRYTGDPPFESIVEAQIFLEQYDAFRKHGMGRWYAFLKEDDTFIGWCGLKYSPEKNEVDVGYRLLQEHWGKGYATEASEYCLDYGFKKLGLTEIIARSDQRNIASIQVMKKLGMSFCKNVIFDEMPGVVYKMTKENWNKR